VQQVRIQLALRVPDGCDAAAYHADLKTSFLESYAKKDEWFQMSVQGLGTPIWQLQGRAKLEKAIRHRSARTRIRDIFKKCHDGLGLSPPVNQAYSKYLETTLAVKQDAEPLSGESPPSLRREALVADLGARRRPCPARGGRRRPGGGPTAGESV